MTVKRNPNSDTYPHVLLSDNGIRIWMNDMQLYQLKEKLDAYILKLEERRNEVREVCGNT